MSRRRSIFVGKTVRLIEGDRPLLYPRCYSIDDALPDRGSWTTQTTALGLPMNFSLSAKRKISDFLISPRSRQLLNPLINENDDKKESKDEVDSSEMQGIGNAGEAKRMRELMGLREDKQKTTGVDFAFSFNLQSSIDDEIARSSGGDVSVFASGMPYAWSRDEVWEYWSECGAIMDVDCLTFHDTGRFKGIAKITYASTQGAEAALACDGESWEEYTLTVSKWKSREKAEATSKPIDRVDSTMSIGKKVDGFNVLFMCNIPWTMHENDIAELFSAYKIEAVKLMTDEATGKSKGCAHIQFQHGDNLERAIREIDRIVIDGRTVRLGYANPPPNWRPKTSRSRKSLLQRIDNDLSTDRFRVDETRFLIRLSGLQPTTTDEELRQLFPKATIHDIVLIWSAKKLCNSGAAFIVVTSIDDLQHVLSKKDTFFRGRRLHTRPGKFSDYRQKKSRMKRKKRKASNGREKQIEVVDDEDPLMELI